MNWKIVRCLMSKHDDYITQVHEIRKSFWVKFVRCKKCGFKRMKHMEGFHTIGRSIGDYEDNDNPISCCEPIKFNPPIKDRSFVGKFKEVKKHGNM